MTISDHDIRIIIEAILDAREAFVWARERLDVLREKADRSARYGGEPSRITLEGVVQVLLRVEPHADPQAEELADAWLAQCQDRQERMARAGMGPDHYRQELKAAQALSGTLYVARIAAEEMVKRFAIGGNGQSGAKELIRAWGPSHQRHGLSERFKKACLCLEVATEEIVMNDFFSNHLLDRAAGRFGRASDPAVEPRRIRTPDRPRVAASTPKPKCGGLGEMLLIANVSQSFVSHLTAPASCRGGSEPTSLPRGQGAQDEREAEGSPTRAVAAKTSDREAVEENADDGQPETTGGIGDEPPESDRGSEPTDDAGKGITAHTPGQRPKVKRSRAGRRPEISDETFERWLKIRRDYDSASSTPGFDREEFREARDLATEDLRRILNNTTPSKLKRREEQRNKSAE